MPGRLWNGYAITMRNNRWKILIVNQIDFLNNNREKSIFKEPLFVLLVV